MFGKIRCPRCNSKTSKKHAFCPHCGLNMKGGKEEKFFESAFNLGFPFNTIFRQLEKQIGREFRKLDESFFDMEEPAVKGLAINIDSSNGVPVIRINPVGNERREKEKIYNKEKKEEVGMKTRISEEKVAKLVALPKEEPPTNVRRLTDKIIYEIDLPGVEKENIIITKLQNSIEIKAFSNHKAFFKLIPISLPILNSRLEEGKLILELKPSH